MKKSWKLWISIGCILCVLLMASSGCTKSTPATDSGKETNADPRENWPRNVPIGAATPGGGMFVGASALASVLQQVFPELNATVEVTGAAVENSQLLEAGEIPIGMVTTEIAWEAYNGKGVFEGKPKHRQLRTLLPGYSNCQVFVTDVDYGFTSIRDLDGKIVATGSKGSSNEQIGKRIIECLGINPKIQALRTTDAVEALKNKQITAYVVGIPNSTTVEYERSTGKTQLLFLEGEDFERFQNMFPQYLPITLKAGTLKCVPEDKVHFGGYVNYTCRADLPESFVYEVVKATFEHRDTIIKNTSPETASNLDNTSAATIPYHPGTVKYFKEIGLEIPDHLLPPEN
ncbi:MAG TPA: TAXI family TRAP transporter solute-binding subunit [Corynebacteriales bacterium]|nr:TAXI family TRAP transporter solute-binding subunit [Mycobacteriales bacterium]